MRDYAIFQLDCYEDKSSVKYDFLKNFCMPTVEKYCKTHNIEHIIISYKPENNFYYKEKNKLFTSIANNQKYQKSLFLDLDVYISKYSPSIFDIDFEHIAGCLAMGYRLRQGIDHVRNVLKNQLSQNEYFRLENCSVRPNGGVILFNNRKGLKEYFLDNHIENNLYQDEMFLSYKIANRNLSFTIISDIWNNRNINKYSVSKSYFTHILSHSFMDNSEQDKQRNLTITDIKEICKNI